MKRRDHKAPSRSRGERIVSGYKYSETGTGKRIATLLVMFAFLVFWSGLNINMEEQALFARGRSPAPSTGKQTHASDRTDVSIVLIPDNPPVEVPAGESFSCTGILTNNLDETVRVDVWFMARLPNGNLFGPVHQWNNVRLAPFQEIVSPVVQDVPPLAPLVALEYVVFAGDYPSTVIDMSEFGFRILPQRESVMLELKSPKAGKTVQPGETVDWKIKTFVSTYENLGLAMISADLVQDPANPEMVDLSPGNRAPSGMEGFDRPGGFTNPSDDPWGSGYGGTPVDEGPHKMLRQIGGAQNSFGIPGSCLGPAADICQGQDIYPDPGIGQGTRGQTVATGTIVAPQTAGTYTFSITDAMANTFDQINNPPVWSTVKPAKAIIRKPSFLFHVSGPSPDRERTDSPPLRSATLREAVILPPENTVLNRLHTQFRWVPFEPPPSEYTLWIVEDDLSGDPFNSGLPLLSYQVDSAEPRTVVTAGLAFGTAYAWCVTDGVLPTGTGGEIGPTHRFRTLAVPDWLPDITVTRPGGPSGLEPGVTLFTGSGLGTGIHYAVGMDELDNIVYLLLPEEVYFLLGMDARGRLFGGLNQAIIKTVDGKDVWASPPSIVVHHDGFPKPDGNFLTLRQETRTVMVHGEPRDYIGDVIVEFNLHTREIVWEWVTFDHWSVEDYSPPEEWPHDPDDWTHCNAVVYDEALNRIYVSSRHLSRISCIDYDTGDIIYNMGKTMPSGDTDFGHNLFSYQHAPELLPNGHMMVYDNGNLREPLADPRQTKAIELAFDNPVWPTDAWIVWEHALVDDNGDPVFCESWGDADRLPGGNTLITGGEYKTVYEVDANSDLVRRINIEEGTGTFYQAEHVPALITDTPGDTDGDWDLDLSDFAALQTGFTGVGPALLSFPDTLSDFDGDDDIDMDDCSQFIYWMTGAI